MKRKRIAVRSTAAFIIILIAISLPVTAANKLNIVASTTLLQSAAKDIGGKRISVSVLIAPGSCPGHYDICPQDIRKLSSSKLVLTHGYESFLDKIIKSMGKNKPKLVKVDIKGNWMVPDVYISGAKKVTDALCKADPKNSADYRKSLSSLQAREKKLTVQLNKRLKNSGAAKTAVICSDQLEPLVKWMGFKVVATYTRAEEFTPQKLHNLATTARKQKVRLVIDNLQSGPSAGKEFAKDIGAVHVTLSNFPGGFAGTETWNGCVRDNVNRVIKGIAKK